MVQTEGVTDLLMAPADLKDSIPGISGTRNLTDNISDLKAQVCKPTTPQLRLSCNVPTNLDL